MNTLLHCCRLQAIYSPITGKNFVNMYSAFDSWNRGYLLLRLQEPNGFKVIWPHYYIPQYENEGRLFLMSADSWKQKCNKKCSTPSEKGNGQFWSNHITIWPRTQGRLPLGDTASPVHTESVCEFLSGLCMNIKRFSIENLHGKNSHKTGQKFTKTQSVQWIALKRRGKACLQGPFFCAINQDALMTISWPHWLSGLSEGLESWRG